jgi:hypothetical protein
MPALDLSLGLGIIGSTAHMLHTLPCEPPGKIVCHVTRTIVVWKPWPVSEAASAWSSVAVTSEASNY